jgi:pimeloyl-ACP methyl ester carboxylesterase
MSRILERTVYVAGGPCRVWEKGEGAPLGIVFGLGGCPRWSTFLELLAEKRHVIVPSLPGFQGAGTQYRQLDGHLDWIAATLDLLEAANLQASDLVAFSVAGMLCAEVAALSPGFIKRLALCDPYGIFDTQNPGADVFALMPQDAIAAQTTNPARYKELFDAPEGDEEVESKIALFRANEAAARIIWPFGDRGLEKRLARIRIPTLLLWGDQDRIVPPSYIDRFAAGIAGPTESHVISDAGHQSWMDQPERCAESILAFLTQ